MSLSVRSTDILATLENFKYNLYCLKWTIFFCASSSAHSHSKFFFSVVLNHLFLQHIITITAQIMLFHFCLSVPSTSVLPFALLLVRKRPIWVAFCSAVISFCEELSPCSKGGKKHNKKNNTADKHHHYDFLMTSASVSFALSPCLLEQVFSHCAENEKQGSAPLKTRERTEGIVFSWLSLRATQCRQTNFWAFWPISWQCLAKKQPALKGLMDIVKHTWSWWAKDKSALKGHFSTTSFLSFTQW